MTRAFHLPSRLLRWTFAVETIVAAALALTAAAVWLREPLTTRDLDFGPKSQGAAFFAYDYGDQPSGGTSTVETDPKNPLALRCTLTAAYQWPYCGLGLLFDREHEGRGIDLSRYGEINVRLWYRGSAGVVRLVLKDHDPRYAMLAGGSDKVNQATYPVRDGEQTIPLNLADFAVAEWWKDATRASGELARPSFGNVVAMELIAGNDGKTGVQEFRVERISFRRQIVSAQAWYGGIIAFWLLLIASTLLFRRRQLRGMRRSAEQALRASEQLYRGIMQASTDAIVLLDDCGYVKLVNDAAFEAMELDSADAVVGKHWTRLWRDESGELVGAELEKAERNGTARFRGFCATSKGTPKWWDVVVAAMRHDDGSLKGMLTIARDITGERERSEQLKWASEHDPLTQLPNRRAFQSRLQAAVLRAMASGGQIGLLLIDLDHFKHVNDSLGHSAGDDLLKSIGERLRRGVREGDFVARIGGDEFAIVLEDLHSEDAMLRVGDELQVLIQSPMRIAARAVRAGASIGGALFPKHAASADDLFKNADTALYALKQDGRGGTRLFDYYMLDEAERSASQLRLARSAVTDRTVVPVYQPKFDIVDGSMSGLEALLRWRHPRKGLQLPATLEEAFADYELAAKIGELMQRKVAGDMRSWLDSDLDFGRVAINAAPAEFLRDDYAEHLLAIMSDFGIPANRLEIEITEHAFLGRANEYVARALGVLKEAGVTIALDDFGTGASSLSHLRDFPVDVAKIDMSFVQRMTEDDEICAIVTAVVRLASSLSIEVVAEGVEKPAELELLRAMGCRFAQGHLFTPAVEASAIARMVATRKAVA
ncbi:putative bifunctional diguanylate cyclase/phosphodiesterase [Sphingomonas segetis]|uniref:putative bifunctional diguanylate cyclase/phosphodiesterase n=1 Tax=Sphingomonas segetis TaxID=1104779 RepID=UPI0012D2CAD7|nr:EAL domain-containing protein [Sphingomonas segetis]